MTHENRLSGITLASHKTFQVYLLEMGERSDFTYDLDQFDHELRTYALRIGDADIVKHFLKGMMDTLGGKGLLITSEHEEMPSVELSGTQFPKVSVRFGLAFMKYPHSIILPPLQVVSDDSYITSDKYADTTLYTAWQRLIDNLPNENISGSMKLKPAFKTEILKEHRENRGDYFKAEVSIEIKDDSINYRDITLDEIVERTKTVCGAVQQSYNATKNLPIEYNRHLADIQSRLLAQHQS